MSDSTEYPHRILNVDGLEILPTRYNTKLYTFWGELSVFDHVYIDASTDNSVKAYYIFNSHTCFESLKSYIEKNNYPQVRNTNVLFECDEAAYGLFQDQQLEELLEN